MAAIPLISHGNLDSAFAYRAGQRISAGQFIQEVTDLAERLPERSCLLNLCTDRYHFTVGFAAALLRQQINLLPPNHAPGLLEQLRLANSDLYCLTDGETNISGIETIVYPQQSLLHAAAIEVPAIPAAQRAARVFTSGSTGHPVAHEKSWGSLCRSAEAEAQSICIAPDSGMVLLGTVPAQHMYGLETTILLAMRNGLALAAERPFFPLDICAQLAALPHPRCLVTTPVHLRALLSASVELPAVELVVCATAHLALHLAKEAEARFAAPLYEIYGCTEAGQVASRRPTQGAAWHLMSGIALHQDEQGSRVKGGHVEIAAPLSDVIELHDDGTFTLHGRTADLVNIAGKRTSLASLNHHLTEIEGVQDGVFFMPDDGDQAVTRPAAFVVAPGLDSEAILGALRNKVDAVFLPRPLYFVESLPRNTTGKLTREALLQLTQQCAGK